MNDKKPPILVDLPEDDIPDTELEAIAEGMLKGVLERKAQAQRKLDNDLATAMAKAKAYFSQPTVR
ncbi:hypothetical protein [Thiothrix subterranea]|uniref:Uncharacterized protein n=1 Tax=Thiothrix subterranea TaxID=2735563 RepID=A0AA51MQV0_9GAMM|nr:hypothetical protein [Thiothrix subterranea]MDQ5767945.1 hypothetical protein [Thiothrix subterranea]WML86596.1 hypothetical protein RCG00_20215 [Thiothrix subterranea]